MQIADYVRQRDGEYFVGSTRVTLRSVIADWQRGQTAEDVAADFPGLPLVAIYGAITAYLERQDQFDSHFRESDMLAAQRRAATEAEHPAFFADMRQRVERVRPSIQAELRGLGILDETPPESPPAERPTGDDTPNRPEA